MEYYSLGEKIIAFTTDRTVGRDKAKLFKELHQTYPILPPSNERAGVGLYYPHQTHTDRIFQITEEFLALPWEEQKPQLEGFDAVIYQSPKYQEVSQTNQQHTNISSPQGFCPPGNGGTEGGVKTIDGWEGALGISTADCIPVIVYDKANHAAAAIHAGWKGTVKRIVEKAIARMQEVYGTNPADCTAAIGPGISQESFEVGWEVVETFRQEGFDMDRYVIEMPNMHGEGQKPHIDLKEINRQQLLRCGLTSANIFVSPIDTFTDERFFSARREQKGDVKCGRILSGFILL